MSELEKPRMSRKNEVIAYCLIFIFCRLMSNGTSVSSVIQYRKLLKEE